MKKFKLALRTLILFFIATALIFQSCLAASSVTITDTQPPSIPSGLTVTNITYTSISLSWAAASDNVGVKGYQIYRDGKKIVSTKKNSYTNSDLIPGKRYVYVVKAYDAAGNLSGESIAASPSTKSDTEAPSVPTSLAVYSTDYTSIALTWNPSSDNTSIKGYEVFCGDKKAATTSSTYYVCKSLTPGKTYTCYVKAYDVAGNYSIQSNTITAATKTDNTAPSIPTGVKTSSVTGTEINLVWNPSTDNVKVKGYEVYCDRIKIGTTSKASYCNKNLTPGKKYSYTIKAVDSIGNLSDHSNPLDITTQRDTEAPTAPTGLKASSLNGSSISLTWNASTDNIKVKGYQIFCNGFKIAATTRTYCTVKSPVGLGLDVYSVKAYDLVDNLSGSSNSVTVITLK